MANVMKPATMALWAALSLFLYAATASAQTPEQVRIDALERRVGGWEARVRALLAAVPERVSAVSDTTAVSANGPEESDTSETTSDVAAVTQPQQIPSLGPPRAADETSAVSRTGPISG